VVDSGMSIQQAIDAPRIHHQWLPDETAYEPFGLSMDTQKALEAMGHKFVSRPRYMGDAQGIMIEEKRPAFDSEQAIPETTEQPWGTDTSQTRISKSRCRLNQSAPAFC